MTAGREPTPARADLLLTIVGNAAGLFEDRAESVLPSAENLPPELAYDAVAPAGPDSAAMLALLTDWLPRRD